MVHWACHASQCALHSAHQAIQRQWGCLAGLWAGKSLQTLNKVVKDGFFTEKLRAENALKLDFVAVDSPVATVGAGAVGTDS